MNAIRPQLEFIAGLPAPRRRVWLVAALLVLTGIFGMAQTTNEMAKAPGATDYSSFKIITDRNIFDPNRHPHSARRHESRSAPAVDSFSLAGTMIYQKGRFAFFDGSNPDYRKILEPGGVVAGYKVTQISAGSVKLEAAGKQIELKVGAQMRHEDDGTWQAIVNEAQLPEAPVESADAPSTETGAPAASDPNLDGNDVLKRLMQQREQETK